MAPALRMPSGCRVCGRIAMAAWYQNSRGERWCQAHGEVRGCTWCSSVERVQLDGGLPRCSRCRASGVTSEEQVAALRDDVLAAIAGWFGPHDLQRIPVAAVGGALVVRGSRRVGRTHASISGGLGSAQISFTPGMPRSLAGAVLAHEYGHVLLNFDPSTMQRRPRTATEPAQVEGFCEVLAAAWLATMPGDESDYHRAAMDRSEDPVYGHGFRVMQRRAEQVGSVRALLDELAAPVAVPPVVAIVDPAPAPTTVPDRSRVRRSSGGRADPRSSSDPAGAVPTESRVRATRRGAPRG